MTARLFRPLIAIAFCLGMGAAALAQSGDAPVAEQLRPANIDRNGVIILVRGALAALDQANSSGNYTVLRDIGSPEFQANSAADLAEIFAPLRRQRLDLGGTLVLEPQLTVLPQIDATGLLHMAGFFPSVPMQVNFELQFAPHQRQWKLFGLAVEVSEPGPVAPETGPLPTPPISREEPEPPGIAVEPGR